MNTMIDRVSITHRYGSTTVFTAFSVFIIPLFPCFSIVFPKKVGQPLHSKFPQSLDSTGFFIFVKIDSEVHRLFGCFFLFSALFHAVFVLEALILLARRFTDFFYRFFNNPSFNSTYTVYMACPSTHISEIAILPAPSIVYKSVTCFYRPPCCPVLSQTLL